MRKVLLAWLLILALVVTACSSAADTTEESSQQQEQEDSAAAEAEQADADQKAAEEAAAKAQAELDAAKAAEAEAKAAAEQAAADKAEAERLLAEANTEEEKAAAQKLLAESQAAQKAAADAVAKAAAEKAAAEKAAAEKAAAEKAAAAAKAVADKAAAAAKATNTAAVSSVSAKGVFPITKEKKTLKIMMQQHPAVLDYVNNELTKYLETRTNVKIEWQLVPAADWNTKLNLVLASNTDLPDIIMGGVSSALVSKYGPQGVFLPLNNLIEKHSVEYVKIKDKVEGTQKMITATDGNIYGLPKISECYNCTMSRKMWVNKTFLDALDLPIPKTTDDFYKMLKAFKEKDPNKNGKADEIPLLGATTGWQQKIDMYLMSSFVLNDGGYRFVSVNGTLQAAYATPEWKSGLSYMKKLADEKLLDPVSFTQKDAQLRQLVENKDTGIVGAVSSGSFNTFANPNGTRLRDYISIPPLKGPTGLQQSVWDPYFYVQVPYSFVVTNACKGECADIAVKWADQFYNVDITARSRLGVPDVDWKRAPQGTVGVNGKPAQFEAILIWGANQKSHWQFTNPGYWPRSMTEGPVFDPKNPWELQYALTTATTRDHEPYKSQIVPPLNFTPEEAEQFNQLSTVINAYVEESLAQFVLGNKSLDKDWDNYLKELDNMGMKKYLQIAQKAYDRQWK